MPIVRLLQNSDLDPATIEIVSTAFEQTRLELGLIDRTDPLTELLAHKFIEAAQTGQRDPQRLRQQAIDSLGVTKISKAG